MPLAGHGGEVAGLAQHFGDGDAVVVQLAAITGYALVRRHPADAGLMRVESGQQRGSRRAAATGVVELREPRTARGQTHRDAASGSRCRKARCPRSPCHRP